MKIVKMLSRAEMKNVGGGNLCQPNEFACANGTCIDASLVLDGTSDCSDGSDEAGGSSPKIEACAKSKRYDPCSFDYNGTTYHGKCDTHMASVLYCSTLL
ncbi:Low-density lipoprotein receptor domain class A [Pedobacter steynii]|uniref:Low-density lipoprotein receptor domain class A n=2 Tax=Pedobacter steynii TaxID=430522 RepID=A0A1H0JPY3_9SPHI|nr:Low-density lipoprotein receptor domain class A [Pedobacter steynii]